MKCTSQRERQRDPEGSQRELERSRERARKKERSRKKETDGELERSKLQGRAIEG